MPMPPPAQGGQAELHVPAGHLCTRVIMIRRPVVPTGCPRPTPPLQLVIERSSPSSLVQARAWAAKACYSMSPMSFKVIPALRSTFGWRGPAWRGAVPLGLTAEATTLAMG